jgi:hypothetical protein
MVAEIFTVFERNLLVSPLFRKVRIFLEFLLALQKPRIIKATPQFHTYKV